MGRHGGRVLGQGVSIELVVLCRSKDEKIKKTADRVVIRVYGHRVYHTFVRKLATTLGEKVKAADVPMVNFWARVYATSGDLANVRMAKIMVTNIMPTNHEIDEEEEKHRAQNQSDYVKFPNVETVNTILDGILKLHQEQVHDLDVTDDLIFCDSLMEYSMSRREAGVWATSETFELMMNLCTTLKPSNIGQRMEELISKYETVAYLSKKSGMSISLATYNRVMWAIWEEAKAPQPRRTSQRALDLLNKLEMLSMPLLLTKRQVEMTRLIQLYEFDLRPNTITYDMVLSVCADTAAESEFVMAAQVALVVARRILDLGLVKSNTSGKIEACMDRLSSDSELVGPLRDIREQIRLQVEKESQTEAELQKEESNPQLDDTVQEV